MSSIDIVTAGLEQGLMGTDEAQKVIANNIANISTPGFKRATVSFQDALATAMESGNINQVEAVKPTIEIDNSTTGQLDGNNVDLNVEMTDLAKNQLTNQTFQNLLTKRFSMIQTAEQQVTVR